MQGIVDYIVRNHWGEVASVVGLTIALLGFAITIIGVWRSKSAAESAERAAVDTKAAIVRQNIIADFTASITTMNEIKRLHRVEAWQHLPDRYSALRQMLISIRSSNPDLPREYITAIQGAIQHFSDIEGLVEAALASGKNPPNRAKLNAIVSQQVDKLSEILEAIKQEVGA